MNEIILMDLLNISLYVIDYANVILSNKIILLYYLI